MKKIVLTALLTSSLFSAIGLSTYVMAADTAPTVKNPAAMEPRCHKGDKHHGGMGMMGGGMMGHPNPQEMLNRVLTADQVRTLIEARLIMKGNPNLKVGEIKSTTAGFDVNIVTQEDSLVETLKLAKNGLPEEMQAHMKERMENKTK